MYMFAIAEFIFPPTNALQERKQIKLHKENAGLWSSQYCHMRITEIYITRKIVRVIMWLKMKKKKGTEK